MRHRTVAVRSSRLFTVAMIAGAFALASARPLEAATIDLSWDRCAPIVTDTVIHPKIFQYRLWVSAIGQTEAHQGYEFWIAVHDADGGVPDAWRFDVGGCQPPGSLEIEHLNPVETTKACPTFQGPLASIQIKSYQPAPAHLGLSGMPMVAVLANTYPAGIINPVPTTRYFLGALRFDHTSSVPGVAPDAEHCGAVERPLCFTLIPARANWLTIDGQERPFVVGNGVVTVNGGGCAPVPTQPTTWGLIKSQYRQ